MIIIRCNSVHSFASTSIARGPHRNGVHLQLIDSTGAASPQHSQGRRRSEEGPHCPRWSPRLRKIDDRGKSCQKVGRHSPSTFRRCSTHGWLHLSRKTLEKLSNREEAFAKRGAAWTFDAAGVLDLVGRLHKTRDDRSMVMLAPGFDHLEKDPVEDAIVITGDTSLIILEGTWLLRDEEPWRTISTLVDDTWFVDVDPELARDRVAKRHLESGIEMTWEAAVRRASENDLVNGDEVRMLLVKPGVVVQSVEGAE